MAKKLYIGGLSYSTTQDILKQGFEKVGPVEEAVIITDKMSGRSKGFGFVTMANDEDVQKAIDMYNEKEFDGRKVIVNEARPFEPRQKTGFGGSSKEF